MDYIDVVEFFEGGQAWFFVLFSIHFLYNPLKLYLLLLETILINFSSIYFYKCKIISIIQLLL